MSNNEWAAHRSPAWKRHRIWLLPALGLFATFAVWVSLPFLPLVFGKRLVSEYFNQIRLGMTQQQVEDLLGGSPGRYRRPGRSLMTVSNIIGTDGWVAPAWSRDRQEQWVGEDAMVVVYFSASGVSHKGKLPEARPTAQDWLAESPLWNLVQQLCRVLDS